MLEAEPSSEGELSSCIDLVDISTLHDRRLAAVATTALKAIRTSGRAPDLVALIDNTLDDLTNRFVPEFTMLSLDGKVLVNTTVWGNGSVSTIVVRPEPQTT